MSDKFNPFQPNSPVFTGMFVGRIKEIKRIEQILYQTKNSNPSHIIIFGERGIGKSSLILVTKYYAEQYKENNFLVIRIVIDKNTTLLDLANKILIGLKRELHKSNKAKEFLDKTWDFMKNFRIQDISYTTPGGTFSPSDLIDKVIFSLADTIQAITEPSVATDLELTSQKDGIVLLIDEADNACPSLEIGAFLKNLSETLVAEAANKLLIVLAGLPKLRDVLIKSHKSSLRLFEEIELTQLSTEEIKEVIARGLKEHNEKFPAEQINISDTALNLIVDYSEGYPHFIQQIGYSCFQINTDNIIDEKDVRDGMFLKDGALDKIGDRYYKDLYYNQINVDSYRRILKIMARKWTGWVSRDEIKKEFTGRSTALDNGIRALRERNIILSKEGTRGQYRLQWASFAFWLKNYTERNEGEESKS